MPCTFQPDLQAFPVDHTGALLNSLHTAPHIIIVTALQCLRSRSHARQHLLLVKRRHICKQIIKGASTEEVFNAQALQHVVVVEQVQVHLELDQLHHARRVQRPPVVREDVVGQRP